MNFYAHHIGDFNSGTIHMERVERWIYRDMLEKYYDHEKPLPADFEKLCRLIGVRGAAEREIVIGVLDQKFTLTDDGYHHSRCDTEIAKYKNNVVVKTKASHAAKTAREAKAVQTASQATTWTPNDDHMNSVWSPNQEPGTNNQEPYSLTPPDGGVVPGGAGDVGRGKSIGQAKPAVTPPCPHEEIIALYHEILPMCPRIREWTANRRTKLRARWNEASDRQNLGYWRALFEYVAKCSFLVGGQSMPGRKPFLAHLEWIVGAENFAKIREGNYE